MGKDIKQLLGWIKISYSIQKVIPTPFLLLLPHIHDQEIKQAIKVGKSFCNEKAQYKQLRLFW